MKKLIIFILIALVGFGGYLYFIEKNKDRNKCEDGFRFNPATSSCEKVEQNKKGEIDFSTLKIKTISGREIQLQKKGDTTEYTGTYEGNAGATDTEYISLKSDQEVSYSDSLAIIPYMYNSGGTGQFMYIGIFDKNSNAHLDSIVLGDRIIIDSIMVNQDKAKVNFKDRLLTQSFAEEPTIPTQFVFEIKDNKINPVLQLQNADYSDVEIKSPSAGSSISDILTVKGAIPGSWYFEANAHFRILNNTFKEIAVGNIQALSDWMTTQRVPFELTVPVTSLNYKGDATIIIESENVQGDEEGELKVKRLYIPVVIK